MREANDSAKRLLAEAHAHGGIKTAIQAAMRLGMPLSEIEQYLDALDLQRSQSLANGAVRQPQSPPATSE